MTVVLKDLPPVESYASCDMSLGVWAPFKELASVVHTAIAQRQSEAFYSLETILKKHKPDFLSLLKNPVS